ncbi:uncharacterized protein TNCV_4457011 [Trichonephila clavipes]|nr:uncharacterized protein TNCV_4457011 [Trichonephila clavipes]
MEEIGDLGIPLRSLWPTLHCRRVAGVSLLPSIDTMVPPFGVPEETLLQCQRFGHSQTFYRCQLTCSRCASVGHSSKDCSLDPKCINCSLPHSADSKLCPKWKIEKQIQEIKNKNISYLEARKLVPSRISQAYAQAAKSSPISAATQTDENITKIKCPPLNLLQPLSSPPKPNISQSTPAVTTSSSSNQAQLLPSTSSIVATVSEPQPPTSVSDAMLSATNIMFTPNEPSSSNVSASPSDPDVLAPSASTTTIHYPKQNSKTLARKRKKELPKKQKPEIKIKTTPRAPRRISYEDEDMIIYKEEELEDIQDVH